MAGVRRRKRVSRGGCDRYREGGRFRMMTCPDGSGGKSRFCGCVRYMMCRDGYSLEAARWVCACIARCRRHLWGCSV